MFGNAIIPLVMRLTLCGQSYQAYALLLGLRNEKYNYTPIIKDYRFPDDLSDYMSQSLFREHINGCDYCKEDAKTFFNGCGCDTRAIAAEYGCKTGQIHKCTYCGSFWQLTEKEYVIVPPKRLAKNDWQELNESGMWVASLADLERNKLVTRFFRKMIEQMHKYQQSGSDTRLILWRS